MREARIKSPGDRYRIEAETGPHRLTLDEPPEKGGDDQGPSPVQMLLTALVSCLTISLKFQARRKRIPIERVEGWVAANEERYIEQIAVELQVWSSAPEEDVRALWPAAERGCFVSGVIRKDLPVSIDLIVLPAEG